MDAIELAIRHRLTPEMSALDVGANRGTYSMLMASVCRRVIAFEPQPDRAEELSRRAPSNLKVERLAVSNRSGTARFFIDTRPGMIGMASSLMELDDLQATGEFREVEVETVTLDEYCKANNVRPDLIKIDVEGWEPNVLEGGVTLIETVRPSLLFEFWESHYRRLAPWFDRLSETHFLVRAEDGEPAREWYAKHSGTGTTDILAIPRGPAVPAART